MFDVGDVGVVGDVVDFVDDICKKGLKDTYYKKIGLKLPENMCDEIYFLSLNNEKYLILIFFNRQRLS